VLWYEARITEFLSQQKGVPFKTVEHLFLSPSVTILLPSIRWIALVPLVGLCLVPAIVETAPRVRDP